MSANKHTDQSINGHFRKGKDTFDLSDSWNSLRNEHSSKSVSIRDGRGGMGEGVGRLIVV